MRGLAASLILLPIFLAARLPAGQVPLGNGGMGGVSFSIQPPRIGTFFCKRTVFLSEGLVDPDLCLKNTENGAAASGAPSA